MRKCTISLVVALMIFVTSCSKKADCYDPELKRQFETIDCTSDCPKVKGCDGNTYCNECIANSNGIRVVK